MTQDCPQPMDTNLLAPPLPLESNNRAGNQGTYHRLCCTFSHPHTGSILVWRHHKCDVCTCWPLSTPACVICSQPLCLLWSKTDRRFKKKKKKKTLRLVCFFCFLPDETPVCRKKGICEFTVTICLRVRTQGRSKDSVNEGRPQSSFMRLIKDRAYVTSTGGNDLKVVND